MAEVKKPVRRLLLPWQRRYAAQLSRQLDRQGVALLQLPTGSGKTAIALHALQLQGRGGVVALPRRSRILEWKNDQMREENGKKVLDYPPHPEANPWPRDLVLFNRKVRISLCSHRQLTQPGDKFTIKRRKWSGSRYVNKVLIIDEVHRTPKLLKYLAKLRRRPPCRIIFVSATPVNPVRLDEMRRGNPSEQELDLREDASISKGYLRLYQAILKVRKRNARVPNKYKRNLKNLPAQSAHLDEVKRWLKNTAIPVIRPCPLNMKEHHPRLAHRRSILKSDRTSDFQRIRDAVSHLVEFQSSARKFVKANPKAEESALPVAERLAIAGFDHAAKFPKKSSRRLHHNLFKGSHYKACQVLQDPDTLKRSREMSYKLEYLAEFLRIHFKPGLRAGRVLIFCKFRKTVNWVSRWLEEELSRKQSEKLHALVKARSGLHKVYGPMSSGRIIWDTESYKSDERKNHRTKSRLSIHTEGRSSAPRLEHKLVEAFNQKLGHTKSARGLVLVCSDRLSESFDLHGASRVMIHFDLDWSPLRLIQRVGRLWRLNAFGQRKLDPKKEEVTPPLLPQIYHLRYPCSADDELYSRLRRRWEHLKNLEIGLDVLSFEQCVGAEIGAWKGGA